MSRVIGIGTGRHEIVIMCVVWREREKKGVDGGTDG
jgi:hypothetical protein